MKAVGFRKLLDNAEKLKKKRAEAGKKDKED